TPPMIANFLLPLFTSHLADTAQILIADQSLLLAVAMLPNLRIPLRRYRRSGFAFADRLITIALVIRAIAANLLNLILDLLKQIFQYLVISNIVGRHHRRDDLAGRFIGTEVQLAPGAALRVAVLTDFPFAFTKDLHAGRINDHVQRFVLLAPGRHPGISEPERQASALDELCVTVFPVAETVGLLGFLGLHKSRIPALSSPCFMQQRP